MTEQEKAKAYDEAVERINKIDSLNKEYLTPEEVKSYILPELEESEDERMIRKIRAVLANTPTEIFIREGIKFCECNDWLEKQEDGIRVVKIDDADIWTDVAHYVLKSWCGDADYLSNPALSKLGKELKERFSQNHTEHFDLKAGHWYICHRAFCCRADCLTIKEGERFMCEKDGIVKGFVIKNPEKYFKETVAPLPFDVDQNPINEDAEKEKTDYVSGQFLYCRGSFNEFEEGNSYWFEYVGNDTYIGRSDNILNQKFHITPRQLYTWLVPEHDCNSKQKSAEWSEEDENKKERLISIVKRALHGNEYPFLNDNGATELITWLKSLRPQQKSIISDTDKSNLKDAPAIIRKSNHPFKENIALIIEKYL